MDGFKRRLSESVQLRLSFALSVAIFLVALAAGVFAFVSAFDEAHELQDENLRQVAALFDRQHMTLRYPDTAPVGADDETGDEESRVIIQYLADGAKATHDGDTSLPLRLPTTLSDGLSTLEVGGEPFRVLVRTTAFGERIAVAQEVDARDKDARESAWRSLLPFLILFPVLLMVVGDLVRKLFRPIATLSREIDGRAEQALHPVDEQHVPVEVRPFVVAINRLLGRVQHAMDNQSRFVADAAHELRSPLTALSLQAERLANTEMSIQARERLGSLRQGIDRGRKLIDQLLSLAKAQSEPAAPTTPVSVQAVYRRVLEAVLPLAQDRQIDIGVEGEADVLVLMYELDLFTLVKNLVDNAIRYTPDEGRIDLCIDIQQGKACLRVCDSGPGIAVEERQRVFDPFYRSLGSDDVGSGLGLSIVKAICNRAGADIELSFTDADTRCGLCVTITLALSLISSQP